MDDSEKAFEEWYFSDEKIWRNIYRESAIAAWRASGRWHRLAALRDAERIASAASASIQAKIAETIAAEERKEEHGG